MLKTRAYADDVFGNPSSITTSGTPRGVTVGQLTNRISAPGYDAAGSMTSFGEGGTTFSRAGDRIGAESTAVSHAMARDLTLRHERRR